MRLNPIALPQCLLVVTLLTGLQPWNAAEAQEQKAKQQSKEPASVPQQKPPSKKEVASKAAAAQPTEKGVLEKLEGLNWLLTLILTGALVVIYSIQARSMSKQVKYMQEGLDINRIIAKATELSADAAKRAFEMTQRARITITAVEVHNLTEQPVVRYTLLNTGHSPATGLVHGIWVALNGEGERLGRPELEPYEAGEREIIDPGAQHYIERLLCEEYSNPAFSEMAPGGYRELPILATEDQLDFFNNTLSSPIVGIRVVYWDGFHNEPRFTESRHRFNPDNGAWGHDGYNFT